MHIHPVWFILFTFDGLIRPAYLELRAIGEFSWPFLLLSALSLLVRGGITWYTYRAFRRVYEESRWSTIWKMTLVFVLYAAMLMAVVLSFFYVAGLLGWWD